MKIKFVDKFKALDDLQDKSFISKPDRLVLQRAGLDFYNYLSYDTKDGTVKIIEAIKAGKKKLNMNYVFSKLREIAEKEEDFYVKSLLKELLTLNPKCFWIEVSKEYGTHTKYDAGCRRVVNLGIRAFEAHHAYKEKSETDKPYNESKGLYKKISKTNYMVYMYYSEDDLINEILKKLRELGEDPKRVQLGLFDLDQLKELSKL